MFIIKQLSEKVLEKKGQMAVACVHHSCAFSCVHLEKAHGKVRRKKQRCALGESGVKAKLIRWSGHCMQGVRHVYELVEGCQAASLSGGVKQGCVLSL